MLRETLSNGLTVITQENRAARVVAIQIWVKAGSADETDAEAGLAHLHEHMLFKGTARRGPGAIAREIEGCGGDINAWTGFDQTVYHLVVASRFFSAGLDVLADAITGAAFDPLELEREIGVVLEEIKRTYDSPSRRVSRELFSTAYAVHPYRRPVIGYEETVRGFAREKVLDFYRRRYAADNICVVAVGDLDERAAQDEIARAFERAPARSTPPPARAPEPVRAKPRARVVVEPIKEAYLSLAWSAPALRDDDVPALDVLAVVLGQGDSSRLAVEVKRERRLVNDVYAYCYTPRDPGLLIAGATLPAARMEEAAAEMVAQVERLRREGPTPDELETARHIVESDAIYQRETVQGQARKLGFFETVGGGVEFEERYYQRVAQVTADEIRQALERHVRPETLSMVALAPREGEGAVALSEDALIRAAARGEESARKAAPRIPAASRAPAAARAPASASRVGEAGRNGRIRREVLPSGVTLLVKEEHAVPLFALRAVWPGGLRWEDAAWNGVNHLTARTITRGTRARGAEEISRAVDEMAGALAGNSGRNSFGVRGEFLSRHFERAFRLAAECLTEPAFAEDEVERERAIQIEEIRARDDNPAGAVFDLFARTLYTRHPYRFDVLGGEESVAALSGDRLREWFRAHYPPSALTLCVVGDVQTDAVRELASTLFDGAAGRASPHPAPPDVPQEPAPDGPRRVERDVSKAQSHILVGFQGTTVVDPDRFALEVLAAVLAGQGGRLFLELRDKRSLAYSITSFSVEGLDPGYFAVYMGTSPEKVPEALDGIRAELRRVVDSEVGADELSRARTHLIGTHEIGLQKNSARAAIIAFDECYGVGADSYLRYADEIAKVTAADVHRVARRILRLDRDCVAIVRPP